MLSGLILAGGRSSRMGRDKAQLTLPDGRALLQRQADVLREAGAENLFLSVRPGAEYGLSGVGIPRERGPSQATTLHKAEVIVDAVAEAGPLAGIAAGLRAAPAGLVLVLAVDMPRVDPAHLAQLLALASSERGVVPVVNGQLEPLVAIYPTVLAASADAALMAGQRAVHAWARNEASQGRLLLWDATPEWAEATRSWNTPADLPRA